MSDYDKPKPSLCDSCIRAYFMEGGSVGIGIDNISKNYRQRYCNYPPEDKPRDAKIGRALHMSGYQKCSGYTK